jgi:hypothetical protein
MFDKASEIINLLNIMRLNDGRSELNVASTTMEIWQTQVAWRKRVGDTYRMCVAETPDISDAVVAFGEYR